MSCLSGSPCYNNKIVYSGCGGGCSGGYDPCNPATRLGCEAVVYSGSNLPTTGIDSCDTLCVALQKIDNVIGNGPGMTVTASNGLYKDLYVNDIRLGGPLTQPTIITTSNINTLSILGLVEDDAPAYIITEGSSGVVRKSPLSSISISIEDNVGLVFNTPGILGTVYNTLVPDEVTSIEVGGATPTLASVWKTRTLVEVLNAILFPLQLPTYANPTIGFGTIPSGLKEVGSPLTLSLTPSGVKNAAGAFTKFRIFKKVNAGSFAQLGTDITSITETSATALPNQFGFPDNNNPNHTYTATSPRTDAITIPAPASGTSSTVIYKVNGDYDGGVANLDSLGNLDTRTPVVRNPTGGPQAASTGYESAEQSITGIYPYFWGSSNTAVTASDVATAIQAGTANKVLLSADGTLSIQFNVTGKFIWFAHFVNATRKQSWKTSSNPTAAAIGVDLDPTSIWNTPVNQNVTSPDGYWSGVSFKVYTSRSAQTSATGITWSLMNAAV
jgi:hypothetical protein